MVDMATNYPPKRAAIKSLPVCVHVISPMMIWCLYPSSLNLGWPTDLLWPTVTKSDILKLQRSAGLTICPFSFLEARSPKKSEHPETIILWRGPVEAHQSARPVMEVSSDYPVQPKLPAEWMKPADATVKRRIP